MKEKTIYQISLALTLAGLVFLYFYSQEVDWNSKAVDQVLPDETVKLTGTVTRVTTAGKAIIIELAGEKVEQNEVIIFNSEPLFLNEGDKVEVTGTVETYNGKKEIIADKVEIK